MPVFDITIINQSFESCNEHDLPTEQDAHADAIKCAFEIGMTEIGLDKPLFAAEVKVGCEGEQLARYVVSMGVASLR